MKIESDFADRLTAAEMFQVPFHDIDPAGVAWHGRYFKYFEAARCTLLNDIDYSYRAMTASGYLWPVVDTSVRYLRPLLLEQTFTVTACLREWEMRLVVNYKIEDEVGLLYTKARTVQVPVDAVTKVLSIGSPQVLIDNVQKRLDLLRRRDT
ncbi:MAG: acyl-CoA thioesterase [Woeseia sp.]